MECEFCEVEATHEVLTLRPGATKMAGPYCPTHALIAMTAGYDIHPMENGPYGKKKNETRSEPC